MFHGTKLKLAFGRTRIIMSNNWNRVRWTSHVLLEEKYPRSFAAVQFASADLMLICFSFKNKLTLFRDQPNAASE
jgi:hypothetical protein